MLFLKSFILNLFDFYRWYNEGLSWGELIYFTLTSLIFIMFLMKFYYKVSSKSELKDIDHLPMYNSKDIFSQEIIGESNFVLAEKATSIWVKITVYVLSFLIATTSIYKLLTNGFIEYVA